LMPQRSLLLFSAFMTVLNSCSSMFFICSRKG
jgi:hypothetical protein